MKRPSYKIFALAQVTECFSMLIPIREKFIFSFTANEACFSSSLNLIDFKVIKSFNVSNEIIFFGSFSSSACQMMTIIIVPSICKNSVLIKILLRGSQYYCMSKANCCLSDKIVIEVFNLLRLPKLRREHILITISYSASSMLIKSPLIKLSILSYCSSVVLINIHIDEFNCISIVCHSPKDRFRLNIFTTS